MGKDAESSCSVVRGDRVSKPIEGVQVGDNGFRFLTGKTVRIRVPRIHERGMVIQAVAILPWCHRTS